MAMARSCSASSTDFSLSTSAVSTVRLLTISRSRVSWSIWMRCCSTAWFEVISACLTLWSATILAVSACFMRSTSSPATSAIWAALRTATSRSCASLAYSVSRSISCFCCSASRFLRRTRTSVSCSMSLRFLRRSSISWVSLVRPSASKALSGLKKSRLVWSRPVSETLSSSRPFISRFSDTAACIFCTKETRFSCRSSIAISATTARRASTNLPSTSSLSAEGPIVRMPSVCAALAIDSWVG